MAAYTRQAINYIAVHEGDLFSPDYTRPIRALYAKAHDLSTALRDYQVYAKVSSTEAHLEQALGLKNGD